MTGNIIVFLEAGTYRLQHPLSLDASDSGTGGHEVVWTGAPGAAAIISGADRIRGWKLSNRALDIWAARVPAGLRTRQLYVNGGRAVLARGALPAPLTRWWTAYHAASPIMAHWRNPQEIDFVYLAQVSYGVQVICPLRSIQSQVIFVAQPCWNNSNFRRDLVGWNGLGIPDYVENAYELLNRPGEFYLDDHAHVLYYIPRKGQNMRTADVEAPALQTLIGGRGTSSTPLQDVEFSNLQFSYATWMQPSSPDGFSEIQSNFTITGKNGGQTEGVCQLAPHGTCPFGAWTKEPGNVQLSYDRHVTFLDDRFLHLGAAGLNLDNGSQDDTVAGSVFTDISGNGVELGNVNLPEAPPASQTLGNRVIDNHVYGVPAEYYGGVGILVGYAADTVVSHNQLDHLPYIGISVGWGGWLDKAALPPVPNYSRDNVISDNLIFDYMQMLSDGGGVYTQGITGSSMASGEKVIGNVIHGELGWGWALKSDDGATYVTDAGNAVWDNDGYDWGEPHFDYRGGRCKVPFASNRASNPCLWAPALVKNNWWQQGMWTKPEGHLVETGNQIITSPTQIPSRVIGQAGVSPGFRSILRWKPRGREAPQPVEIVEAFYAFDGKAYVTWHPSPAEGTSPVRSYTLDTCLVSASDPEGCRLGAKPLEIPAESFEREGYAVVAGLDRHRAYRFRVVASSAAGASVASVPSNTVQPDAAKPTLPDRPEKLFVGMGPNGASLMWYGPQNGVHLLSFGRYADRPSSAAAAPVYVLGYRIRSSTGQTYDLTGRYVLRSTNTGGRVVLGVPDLTPGHAYRFSISAITPAGEGPALVSPWETAPGTERA